jgi:hypothetical protein
MASLPDSLTLIVFSVVRKLRLFRLLRVGTSKRRFMDYFRGFEKSQAVQGIFGGKTEEVLKDLKVEFIMFGYMGVDDGDGHLMVNQRYLNSGDREEIYLDVVHELCHVKQHMDGKHLFDQNYDYVNNPTEIEAYRYAVLEAKRIGFSNQRILRYLQMEWMSDEEVKCLVNNIGIDLYTQQ